MSDTPETDQCWDNINFPYSNAGGDLLILAQRLERERDELREQNNKLRDIAERAVKNIREARNLSVIGDWREIDIIQERLRTELDQLKKE